MFLCFLKKKALIINCTPLGSNLDDKFIKKSPIKERLFKYINKDSFIFDIVYQPKETILSKHANKYYIGYLNGIKMINFQGREALRLSFEK